jgi:Holliday junction resolvase RusA-like endonuclease
MIRIGIDPVPKPRMTRSDAWKQRTAVVKFWAYKDALRSTLTAQDVPDSYHIIFTLPMPASWSRKKRAAMLHQPHRSRPDKDNLEKGLLDALFEEDSQVWDGRVSKVWGETGGIIIMPIAPFDMRTIGG